MVKAGSGPTRKFQKVIELLIAAPGVAQHGLGLELNCVRGEFALFSKQ
jgi:hypothetical protein